MSASLNMLVHHLWANTPIVLSTLIINHCEWSSTTGKMAGGEPDVWSCPEVLHRNAYLHCLVHFLGKVRWRVLHTLHWKTHGLCNECCLASRTLLPLGINYPWLSPKSDKHVNDTFGIHKPMASIPSSRLPDISLLMACSMERLDIFAYSAKQALSCG